MHLQKVNNETNYYLPRGKFVSVFRFLLFLLPHPLFFFFFNRLPCILLYVNWHATGKEKKIKRKFLPCFLDYEWLKTCIFNVREFRKNKNLFVLKNKWIRNSNFISRIFFFFLPLMMQNFTHGMQQEKNIHVEIKY
jgi:hypothetical protein